MEAKDYKLAMLHCLEADIAMLEFHGFNGPLTARAWRTIDQLKEINGLEMYSREASMVREVCACISFELNAIEIRERDRERDRTRENKNERD